MSLLDALNEPQRQAVMATDGPLLILAGAGSGKTRVLTHRTAYLIEECGVNPYNIMAITFTNKAAGEMRERIDQMVGYGSESIWVCTFHSTCVRILRRYIDRLGFGTNFTIYDSDDQKTLMKDICKRLEIDTKMYKEKMFLSAISSAKDELIDPIEFETRAAGDYVKRKQAQVYREYQQALKQNNALDFDDLIMKTVELFKLDKEVLASYQDRFRYIMVDEYQDTNTAQFELIRLLALKYQNLCVVGDDDQSIYKFRGANIYNILNFEHHFPDATVIKLEQNYRSTQNILDAANAVIANNQGRKEKRLWTDNGAGDKITFEQLDTAAEEADFVARDIARRVRKGEYQYKDCAILYRTNAQSRLFEERFITANIPYKIFGGVNFYARKEVKDLLAYLKTIDNGQDDLAVRRIINIPKRGIGAASINKVALYAQEQEISFYDALCVAEQVPGLGKAAAKIRPFVLFIQSMKAKAKLLSVADLLQEVIETTGYVRELEAEGTDEAEARIENIDELISKAVDYAEGEEAPTLNGFLENVALVADIDSFDENSDYVVLMTLHSAKGLEFPNVYLAGLEDGLFPSYMSITSDNSQAEIEEERRLAYVGITRAKKNLTITSARVRMVRGQTQYGKVSRFVREIPPELLSGKIYEPKTKEEPIEQSTFQKARKAFRTVLSYGGSGYGKEVGEGYGSTFHSSKATKPVYTKVENQRDFGSVGGALSYQVGDRVRHIKFGDGEVMAIVSGGRDYEVTVDFDKAGTKKMFASFAKLKKI
ncbi:DNA helicase PcrA [Roseburia faecis]|uniref:DNA helicase PcrA n=1 Tax=Roseburia faecis TaxID=301302 RepID=UPI001D008CDE|nr:DNA helicase PcrA [Roseburia faecis]MCB5477110.1 DNA helicase PcrA [Roseburia faecis]